MSKDLRLWHSAMMSNLQSVIWINFLVADQGAALFEKAAGTRLHRDPLSNKCKFLPLGKWRGKLNQEDIPTPYMRLTDTLDMVGVQLCSTWTNTRRKNGEMLQQKSVSCQEAGDQASSCLYPYVHTLPTLLH